MVKELLVGYVLLSGFLWFAGGEGWWPLGKSWRRHVLPAVTVGLLLILNVAWWLAIPVGLVQVGSTTLGYGDKKTWLFRTLVGLLLGVPALVLNYQVWYIPFYTLLMFIPHYIWSKSDNDFMWSFVEVMAGVAQGIAIGYAFLKL